MLSTQKNFTPVSVHFDAAHFWIDGSCGPHMIGLPSDPGASSIVRISLPFNPGAVFSWENAIHQGKEANKYILWDMDFPTIAPEIHSRNAREENEKILAIKHFTKTIYPRFVDRSVGIILHKGPLDFGKPIEKINEVLEDFLERLASFCREMPDSLPVFLCFDVRNLPSSEAIQRLHQKHFGHFVLALHGADFPFPAFSWGRGPGSYGALLSVDKLGLLVPDHPFDELLHALKYTPYRILYKEFANNDWFDLDAIIFDEDTPQIRRILQGFQAAGGEIVSKTGMFGLENEWQLDKYLENRGRGI